MKPLKVTALVIAAFAALAATSCSTTKGFGEDLQKVGSKLETKAEATGGTAPTY
ncbi:entericidin A/B family lipoprotein [Luteolibacter yonseiensis]|uniref:Entericidin A/B family lipoprotein n=1 Tax=Luteolibacter yonseiensis TaxID=1144680 RepID=A0A934R6I8_9BACT|nr:entericidin A/B family lipoprotein [Luteolibacter yonseiensis]MBK1816330.1 entericidin A/B family lipoprotein [Luteolibacter yonseiensis]